MALHQITGGNFLTPDGNPVANGYLKIRLNRDCAISSGGQTGQIGSQSVITVNLDNTGNVSGAVFIWPNDQLFPSGNQYIFKVYTNNGLLVSGPYLVSILSSPNPFILP
jgi:hypothetical protein